MRKPNQFLLPKFKMLKLSTACMLALCVVVAWSLTAATTTTKKGRSGVVDSLTDAGNGKITISWSLESPNENEKYLYEYPEKVCVRWAEIVNGERGEVSEECFSDGMSTQDDLEIDTKIGTDAPATEFTVNLVTYYNQIPIASTLLNWQEITLNE